MYVRASFRKGVADRKEGAKSNVKESIVFRYPVPNELIRQSEN
jgi:hypothetical protein